MQIYFIMPRKCEGPWKNSKNGIFQARLITHDIDGKLRRLVRSLKTRDPDVAMSRWVKEMTAMEIEARSLGHSFHTTWRDFAGIPRPTSIEADIVLNPSVSGGYVYVLRSRANYDLYKIGISRLDCFASRLKNLGLGSSCDLIVSFAHNNYKEREKLLHAEFAPYRLPQSEWFSLDQLQLSYLIRSLLPTESPTEKHTVQA